MGKSELTCDCDVIHSDIVNDVKNKMPLDEKFFELADYFKIFGDTTRIKILYSLDNAKLCVCDISSLLNMTISAVSHQLKILREANLVKTERQGKVVYYSLADNHVKEIIECGKSHINEIK